MKKLIFLVIAIMLLFSIRCHAATLYVREGGAAYPTCNGTADVDYSAGVAPNCAVNHPSWLTGAGSSSSKSTGLMAANDVGVIVNGSYLVGYTMPNAPACNSSNTGDCQLKAPPSGTGGNYTKLIGCTTTGCASEQDRPELYLAGNPWKMMSLDDVSYVEFSDLEITDHYTGWCATGVPVKLCGRRAFESTGGGWHHLKFTNLNVHGLWDAAFKLASDDSISDVALVLNNVDIRANGGDGFAGGSNDGLGRYEGNISFTDCDVEFNGCYENYPLTGVGDDLKDRSCMNHSPPGSDFRNGDGISMGTTGGTWTFTNCNCSHNTSEGIDLLYHGNPSTRTYTLGEINIFGGRFEGNGGNQIKANRMAKIYSAAILGNCNYFYPGVNVDGSDIIDTNDFCRAAGAAITLSGKGTTGYYPELHNSTVLGSGFTLVDSGYQVGAYNNIFYGGAYFNDDSDYDGYYNTYTTLYYTTALSGDYNICYNLNSTPSFCSAGNNTTVDPQFTGTISTGPVDYYWTDDFSDQIAIGVASPARNAGDETAQSEWNYDASGMDRGVAWDIGAYEYDSSAPEPTCDESCDYCTIVDCDASAAGCDWWESDADCHSVAETCNDNCDICLETQAACDASSKPCYWWDSTSACEAVAEGCNDDCDDCSNEVSCEASTLGTCEWWRSTGDCGTSTEACSDHYSRCLTEGTCEAAGFYWYEERCNINPEGEDIGIAKDTVASSQVASSSVLSVPVTVGTNYPPGRIMFVGVGWESAGTTPTRINSVMAGDIACKELRSRGLGTAPSVDEDMEDQAYTGLTSTVIWGTNTIQTDNVFGGTYSSEQYAPAGGSAYLRSSSINQATVYSKFRIYLPSDYASDSIDIFRARDPYPSTSYVILLDSRVLKVYNSPNATTYDSATTIPTGEYVDIATGVYSHDTAGWIKVWVNGALVINQSNIDTKKTVTYSTIGTVDFGIVVNDDPDTAATVYVDDIEVSTTIDQTNYLAMYYCYPDTGAINVTTTFGAAVTGANVGIISLAGVDATVAPIGTVDEGTGTTAADTTTTTIADSWVVDAVASSGATDFTPASGQTAQYATTQAMTMEGSIREAATAGEQSMSWTLASGGWGIITAVIQPASESLPIINCDTECSECDLEADCDDSVSGCYWWSSACHDTEETPTPEYTTGCSFSGVTLR